MLCRLQQISIAPFFSWHICSDLLILILCPSIVLKLPSMIVRANLFRSILYSVHIQFLDSFQDDLQIMFSIEEINWEITKYLSTYRMKYKVLVRYKPGNSKSFNYVSNVNLLSCGCITHLPQLPIETYSHHATWFFPTKNPNHGPFGRIKNVAYRPSFKPAMHGATL